MGGGQATVVLGGIDFGDRLPRGRHGIPHELIAANQRERLLRATASVLGDVGYSSLSVGDLTERAGVSRATFYKLFDDKHDCVIAAQKWSIERLEGAVREAGRRVFNDGGDWPQAVAAGVAVALEFAAEVPGQARLVLASGHSPTEPRLARDSLALHLRLVRLLRDGARRFPGARPAGELAEQAAVGAATAIVENCLAAGEVEALPRLRSEVTEVLLAPYLGGGGGAAEATAVARAAAEPVR